MASDSALIVVMGVSGTGKSTLGKALSQALGLPFIDGDDLHPASNVAKMAAGQPLNDEDREPWLRKIRKTADEQNSSVVIACSALRGAYRNILRGENGKRTYFVFIEGSRETLLDRMQKRNGHFMKATMLDSQLSALESPVGEKGVVVVSADDETRIQTEKAALELRKCFSM
ncbi:P-loop containing nucleoside triphosphate hydrolase protein [Mycena floridula]|nr:P-loop containing nucleoside triphosphate hydrolase protein [Mycena floridula]